MSDAPDRRHRYEIVADLVAERKRTYDLERENAALRDDNRKLALHTAEQATELGKLRDQLEVAEARIAELESALKGMTNHYCELILSGNAGIWNPEDEPPVEIARAALAKGTP